MRKIIHIDMDCFFAAVEALDNPELRGKPFVVGGCPQSRGVVATASYEARKFGIHSAMASAQALRKCPELIFIAPRMPRYKEESKKIREIFHNYTSLVETLSLDEAYLDVSDCTQHKGSATWIAESIRCNIVKCTGLTASAGVAPNKFLAKVASDWNKPNGIKVITPRETQKFLFSLSVGKIPGVGKVTQEKLNALGIHTCGDLQRCSVQGLIQNFGSWGHRLYELARGIDERPVVTHREPKSVSVEETFPSDIQSISQCHKEIALLFSRLQHRLAQYEKRNIGGIVLKLKFSDFTQTTVQSSGSIPLEPRAFHPLLETGLSRSGKPLRLIGLGVLLKSGNIKKPSSTQLSLPLIFPRNSSDSQK